MMRIRLSRAGRHRLPVYRVAVYDAKARRDGPFLEKLGEYDPRKAKAAEKFTLDADRLRYWLGKGARPTESLGRLLKHAGIKAD
jgi:small subunit ribosomal protein S16